MGEMNAPRNFQKFLGLPRCLRSNPRLRTQSQQAEAIPRITTEGRSPRSAPTLIQLMVESTAAIAPLRMGSPPISKATAHPYHILLFVTVSTRYHCDLQPLDHSVKILSADRNHVSRLLHPRPF